MTPARGGSQDKLGHHLCPEAPLSPEDTGVTGRQLQRGLNGVQWRGVLRAAGRELRGVGGAGEGRSRPCCTRGPLQRKGARTGPRTAAAARSSPHLRPEPQARCGPVSQPTRKPECVITKPRASRTGRARGGPASRWEGLTSPARAPLTAPRCKRARRCENTSVVSSSHPVTAPRTKHI